MGQLTLPIAIKQAYHLNQEFIDKSNSVKKISQTQKEIMFQEASLQGELRHPGIVNVYGISILKDDQFALITELVKGDSLEKILHFNKITLSIQEIITIAIQLADALAYCHHRGIVHKDIRSCNIIVSNDMIVKLCDFGGACRLYGNNYNCKYVSTSSVLEITPPEIISNILKNELKNELNKLNSVTEFFDVYSFAVLCWEMCTGEIIWSENHSINEIENQVLSGKRPLIPPHVPIPFANMINACWKQNPSDRPNFIKIFYMLHEMGGRLPLQTSHYNYFLSNNLPTLQT
jgi:serine/threonine protein kinase